MIVSTHESSQVIIISIKNGKKIKASIFEDRPLKHNVQLKDILIYFETIYNALLAIYLYTK